MMRIDARVPVRFGAIADRRPGEAVLLDGEAEAVEPVQRFRPGQAGHGVGCACCAPRTDAARALAALFRQRAVGQGPAFSGVLAVVGADGERAVRAAIRDDVLVAARYRLDSISGRS